MVVIAIANLFGAFRRLSIMRRRSRPVKVDPARQLAFAFYGFATRATYRKRVLTAVNDASGWATARSIAAAAGVTYKQCIDALYALHNDEKVLRSGRKSQARWGKLDLADPAPESNYQMLQSIFNGFVRKPR